MTVVDKCGSFVVNGPKYSVLQCRGPVSHRQRLASNMGAICYSEAHLNSVSNPKVQYGFVITGKNIPSRTEAWAKSYLRRVSDWNINKRESVLRYGGDVTTI